MVFFHGKHHYVLIGKESTWGTAVSATKDVGLVQNLRKTSNMNWKTHHSVGSLEPQDIASGKFDLSGSMEIKFQHGRLLEYITGGTVTHDATNSPDIKHTFTVSDTPIYFTMEEGLDASSDVENIWKGCMLTRLTLRGGLDTDVIMTVDLSAKDIDPSGTTASTQVLDVLPTLKDFQMDLKWGTEDSEAVLNGIQTWEITINNTVLGEPKSWGVGSKLPVALEWTGRTYEFRFTKIFESASLYQDFLGNTNGALNTGTEIASKGLILNIHNNVSAGSGRREISLDFNDAYLFTEGQPNNIGGYIIQEFTGQAKSIETLFTYDDITDASW